MTIRETVKPCPSKESKPPKRLFLLEVFKWAGHLYRVFNLFDVCWRWLKDHHQELRDWLDNLF